MSFRKTPRLIALLLLLAAIGSHFSCKKETSCQSCQSGDHKPVANAGQDQILDNVSQIQLDGSASYDLDKDIVSYQWRLINGPLSIQIISPGKNKTTTSKPDPGTYFFELVVIDSKAYSSTDYVEIVVRQSSDPSAENCYASSCRGYWVCPSVEKFRAVSLLKPPSFPGAFGAAVANGDKIFFGGGHEEGYIGATKQSVNVLNTVTRSWAYNTLSIQRSHLSAVSCGNKVLFAGGANIITAYKPQPYPIPLEYFKTVDIFDANNLTRSVSSLSEARAYMASASSTEFAFFIGGKTISGYSSKMDIYDVKNNTWKLVELPRARANAAAVVTNDKLFIAGGTNSSGNVKTMDVYDLKTGNWSSMDLPHEHPYAAIALVMNKILVAGGDGLNNKSVDIFDLTSSTWTSAELSNSRYHMAVAVANNTVLFLGGNNSCHIDIYKAVTNEWQLAHLNEQVTGVAGAGAGKSCAFAGLLYNKFNALTETVILIDP